MGMVVTREVNYSGGVLESIKRVISPYEIVNLRFPTNVLKRAKLICMYIQEEAECLFEIESLLEILYFDLVEYAIKNYNPSRILKEVTRKERNFNNDVIVIQIDGEKYEVSRSNEIKYSTIGVKIPKKEYRKGQIILEELEALYGYKIPFEVMLSNLLVNFIEDYKEGINKKACASIVKMLKKVDE